MVFLEHISLVSHRFVYTRHAMYSYTQLHSYMSLYGIASYTCTVAACPEAFSYINFSIPLKLIIDKIQNHTHFIDAILNGAR